MTSWAAACVLAVLLMGRTAGRELQPASAPVAADTASLAAKPASQLATSQAANSLSQPQQGASAKNAAVRSTPLRPHSTSRKTINQVNADAPTITDPGTGVSVRPVASSQLGSVGSDTAAAAAAGPAAAAPEQGVAGAQSTAATAQTAAAQNTVTATAQQQPQSRGVVQPQDVQGASPLDQDLPTGDYFSFLQGVRLALPIFGTGYNFCVDRYIESFPRVGIVIPNPAIWLLPQFQDLAAGLSTTLSLPNLLPHGAFAEPTSDGFLLWLPSEAPSEVSNFGIRYGVQIGQAFGYDFGFGVLKDICTVSFVLV